MYTKYYFHIQLTETSEWIKELGTSLSEVMSHIATYDTIPYSFFKTPY